LALSEFALIKSHFTTLTQQRGDVIIGIGDDCAVLKCPPGKQLAVSIDTLVEGIHFFPDVPPKSLGHKALAVSLSDLAAMGAEPAWFTLALTLPKVDETWLTAFSSGLAELAKAHNIQLVGGDTTRGPLAISIQVHGFVDPHTTLTRTGARPGDLIVVTGTLGDAGAALKLALNEVNNERLEETDRQYLFDRLQMPAPRLNIADSIKSIATSAIDISDGLLADLGHILERSQVGAEVDVSLLPLSQALKQFDKAFVKVSALSAGDDYELCFTVSPDDVATLLALDLPVTQIGQITERKGLYLYSDQEAFEYELPTGYQHFD
jgi:thiamine-monophosphate kinase